jgi:prevent-host-death family protein
MDKVKTTGKEFVITKHGKPVAKGEWDIDR